MRKESLMLVATVSAFFTSRLTQSIHAATLLLCPFSCPKVCPSQVCPVRCPARAMPWAGEGGGREAGKAGRQGRRVRPSPQWVGTQELPPQ